LLKLNLKVIEIVYPLTNHIATPGHSALRAAKQTIARQAEQIARQAEQIARQAEQIAKLKELGDRAIWQQDVISDLIAANAELKKELDMYMRKYKECQAYIESLKNDIEQLEAEVEYYERRNMELTVKQESAVKKTQELLKQLEV
jgi:chromosome segregation ATPase